MRIRLVYPANKEHFHRSVEPWSSPGRRLRRSAARPSAQFELHPNVIYTLLRKFQKHVCTGVLMGIVWSWSAFIVMKGYYVYIIWYRNILFYPFGKTISRVKTWSRSYIWKSFRKIYLHLRVNNLQHKMLSWKFQVNVNIFSSRLKVGFWIFGK